MRVKLKIWSFAIAGIALAFSAWMVLDDFVGLPPGSLTSTRVFVTKRRILQFAHSQNRLPDSLSELPLMTGYDNSLQDEWGRAITYDVTPTGVVTLSSLGRDDKIGGAGKDEDLNSSFSSHDSQGRWADW
jgi:hypothetical protein